MIKAPDIVPELKRVMEGLSKRDPETFQAAMEKMATKFDKAGAEKVEKIRFESARSRQRNSIGQLHTLPTNKGSEMAAVYTPIESEKKARLWY